MASKKGIALTAAIIGGFVAASFLIYFIPQGPESEVITFGDARERLQFAMDRTKVIVDEFNSIFELWRSGDIGDSTFEVSADVSINQLEMMMNELRGKQIPSEWNESYVMFLQVLQNYKAYVETARDYADAKSGGELSQEEENAYLEEMTQLQNQAENLKEESVNMMPESS